MPTTFEHQAPPAPEHRPSDAELHKIVYGDALYDGSPDEPDEISYYMEGRGTQVSHRSERQIAAKALRERVHLPEDYAAKNLARTEAMLRMRLSHMDADIPGTVSDLVATQDERTRQYEAALSHTEPMPDNESWKNDATGNFAIPAESTPAEAERNKPTGRRRVRLPLHRLIRHGYKGRHRT